tara:strand:+ start:123 stop:680 length:558 start_codon:yes stop_codon:yes gene_type:complete
LIKRTLFFLLLLTILGQKAFSSPQEEIINNFIEIDNISFEFRQEIDGITEVGSCSIKYPKLIYCLYNNKDKKEMISNGKGLVIKNNRYNKTYIYPLKTTPLEYILDKDFILNNIRNLQPNIDNGMIEFLITTKEKKISIFFDGKTYDFAGWKTMDLYQKEVFFQIENLKKNIIIDENQFKLPPLN